jgi:hypothetical protein
MEVWGLERVFKVPFRIADLEIELHRGMKGLEASTVNIRQASKRQSKQLLETQHQTRQNSAKNELLTLQGIRHIQTIRDRDLDAISLAVALSLAEHQISFRTMQDLMNT